MINFTYFLMCVPQLKMVTQMNNSKLYTNLIIWNGQLFKFFNIFSNENMSRQKCSKKLYSHRNNS